MGLENLRAWWNGQKLPTDGWILFSRPDSDKILIQKVSEDGSENLSEEVVIPKEMLRVIL